MVFGGLAQNKSELSIGPEQQYTWQTIIITASGTRVQIASLALEIKDPLFNSKAHYPKISGAELSGSKILKMGRNKSEFHKPYFFKWKKL